MWFFEHVKIRKVEKYSGHIPRYLNWKLNITRKRATFSALIAKVSGASVDTDALVWSKAEELLRGCGFVEFNYLEIMGNMKSLHRMHNRDVLTMLTEMTPIYWIFGMEACAELIRKAPMHRFTDLNYEDKSKNLPKLDEMSPTSAQKLCA